VISGYISVVALLSFRMAPLFLVSPIEPIRRSPMTVRIVLVFVISLLISSSMPGDTVISAAASFSILQLLSELVLGVFLVLGMHAAFASIHFAGQLIDLQIGFIAGAMFDPSSEHLSGPSARVLLLCMGLVFYVSDFHYQILAAFIEINDLLPPGAKYGFQEGWYKVVGLAFAAGFVFVSPIIITIWLVDISLSLISRSMPQAQVYFVALPIKVFIGVLMMAWLVSVAYKPIYKLLITSLSSWDYMLKV